jgi:hypothetical protein
MNLIPRAYCLISRSCLTNGVPYEKTMGTSGFFIGKGRRGVSKAAGSSTLHTEEFDHEQMIAQGGFIYGKGRSEK